ncbi:MAG: acyltransferase [Pseudomonadales bacterium]|nr:acyltransferase [Pseudomonadales bacterium]
MFYIKLEALRGIFAILIILAHSPFDLYLNEFQTSSNAYLIVDCFFMLSGWTMALAYQQRISEGLGLVKYLYVRLARFYPVHIFMILLWGVYCYYAWPIEYIPNISFSENYGKALWINTTLLQSFITHNPKVNYPAWTVSAEFFTYILFFILVKFFDNKRGLLLPLVIIITGYSWLLNLPGISINGSGIIGFIRCVSGFYLGVFVFRLGQRVKLDGISGSVVELILFASLMLSLIYGHRYSIAIIISLMSFVLILITCINERSGLIGKAFELPIFLLLGSLSYSIYINHYLLIKIITPFFDIRSGGWYAAGVNCVLILCTLMVSLLTYKFIELPCRKNSKAFYTHLTQSKKAATTNS